MFSISYNLGMEWDGDSPQGSIIYTAALAASFTDKLGGYAEVFGSKHYEDPTVSAAFDCGLTYLLAPNLQLDAEFGVPVTSNGAPFFIGFGAVLRIPK